MSGQDKPKGAALQRHGQDPLAGSPSIDEKASELLVQRLCGEWTHEDQVAFEARLESDRAFAEAYRRVEESWTSLGAHAEAPEIMACRQEAIAYARRASAHRWLKPGSPARHRWRAAAAIAGAVLVLASAWQISPYGYRAGWYRTEIGEQRVVQLEDHSRVAMDAATRMRVRFSADARIVELQEGQAQFSVASDPTRPFKVQVGNHTIIALGTVFTVEYVDRKIHVAMMEGKVAVIPTPVTAEGVRPSSISVSLPEPPGQVPSAAEEASGTRALQNASGATALELSAGEGLRVAPDGHATIATQADIEAATAWRRGKVIIRSESLGEAVHRLNRYSRLQIRIQDDALASERISGVFEAGDTRAFVSAIQRYLPVIADYPESDVVSLRLKQTAR